MIEHRVKCASKRFDLARQCLFDCFSSTGQLIFVSKVIGVVGHSELVSREIDSLTSDLVVEVIASTVPACGAKYLAAKPLLNKDGSLSALAIRRKGVQ